MKIFINSLLVLISVLIPIRFEYLEYLRFVPLSAYYLKFFFPYFISILILIIPLYRILKSNKKQKSLYNIAPIFILILGIISIWFIRKQTVIINFENIVFKNGLNYNSISGELLNGTYKSPSSWDGFGNGVNCNKLQYSNGIPVGKWMNSHKGDLIHSGEYLDEPHLKLKIIQISDCERVDIDNWSEGDYPFLDIRLITPTNIDSVVLAEIIALSIKSLEDKYRFKSIKIIENQSTLKKIRFPIPE